MKKIFLLFTFIFFSITSYAQQANTKQDNKGKEKIRAIKIAYLTEKLDLTTSEAEKFWPLFNEYHKDRRELFHFEKKELKTNYNVNEVSNSEADKILKKIFDCRDQRHQNKIEFNKKLHEILPPKKILILEITEREFNKKLMQKLKDN